MKQNTEYLKLLNTGYSINIKKDYKDNEKMNTFIPTAKNFKLLEKMLDLIVNGKNGSILLSGAYGTGKSFFVSLLLNIISNQNLNELNEYEEKINQKFSSENIKNILKLAQKYLIVFANDAMENFENAVIQGIYQAKKEARLDFELETEYLEIKNKIENWKKTNSALEKKYQECLKNKQITEKEFENLLLLHDKKSIKIFSEIYSEMFYGEKYIYSNNVSSLEEILENFEIKLKKSTNYNGVIYVFDEFGRYLENNIENIDVLQVQKMAEYCNLKNDSNLILITHKDIFNYANKLNKKENINEWNKVSGRFYKEHISYEQKTVLDLIAGGLHKNFQYANYKNINKEKFSIYENNFQQSGIEKGNFEEICDKFYPLNYVTAYILPGISQKIAQNERSLFSFISSDEENALKNIISKEFLIGLDRIYDYFKENFRYLPSDGMEYKVFLSSQILLNKVKEKNEKSLIKSLALLYIYNNPSEIEPTKENLRLILNLDGVDFEKLINKLQDEEIIIYKRNFNHFKLAEENDVNIEKDVQEYVQNRIKNINYSEILNAQLNDKVLYPLEYNENNNIIRFLEKYYLNISESSKIDDILNNKEDGKIVYLLNIENLDQYDTVIEKIKNRDIILVTSKSLLNQDLKILLQEIYAIDNLVIIEPKYTSGILNDEILLYKEEIVSILKSEIKEYFSPLNIEIYSNGEVKKERLNVIVTNYLNEKYKEFIPFNYELINKNKISSQMSKVRIAILDKFLNNSNEICNDAERKNYTMKTSAENTVARLFFKNIFIDVPNIEFKEKWGKVAVNIKKKIKKEGYSAENLYYDYTSNKSQYGLRKGIFSLFLGTLLIKYKEEIVIIAKNTNLEEEITGELIDKIEKNPKNYDLKYQKLGLEEIEYLEDLKKLFNSYYIEKRKNKSENIINAIRNYIYSIPRILSNVYLKETVILNKIIQGIYGDKNASEFLFSELPIRAKTKDLKEVIKILEKDINFLQIELKNIENIILEKFKTTLNESDIEVERCLNNWKEKTKITENSIQLWLKNYKYKNEIQFIHDITEKIKGFDYKNWIDLADVVDFDNKLQQEFIHSEANDSAISTFIELKVNNETLKINSSKDTTAMGKILKKKLETDIKNMGVTVSDEEKKKILIEMILSI